MSVLFTIASTIVALGLLVLFHEWGHYWVAKRCGVTVEKFSIGFGKTLFSFKDRHNTEFAISAIPLGGYVKMLDERNGPVPDEQKAFTFNAQPLWQRAAIIAAGPIANFLLAMLIYYALFVTMGTAQHSVHIERVIDHSPAYEQGLKTGDLIVAINDKAIDSRKDFTRQLLSFYGQKQQLKLTVRDESQVERTVDLPLNWNDKTIDPFEALGFELFVPEPSLRLEKVLNLSPAQQAGLKKGDELSSVNGQPLSSWNEFGDIVQNFAGKSIQLSYVRDGVEKQSTMTPEAYKDPRTGEVSGKIGVIPQFEPWPENMQIKKEFNLLSAWRPAIEETVDISQQILMMLKKLFVGDVPITEIGGPVSIAKETGQSARLGLIAFLGFMALLSINLGVLNLLPIPVLDGGHLLFLGIEAIIRRPIPEKIQMISLQIGFLLMIGFMMFAIINDFSR